MTDSLTGIPAPPLLRPDPGARDLADEEGAPDALPPGTRLDEFEITRILGAGGFGIVYLALDHVLLRYVAIKEFMPGTLAGRAHDLTVAVRAPKHAETYSVGLESFFSEARMLASFDHASLVKVYRFWKANGTAYMAMQFYPGQTLREVRRDMQTPPDESWIRSLIDPLLGALELLHAEGIYHRDIAPDNILLLPDGRPVLLDFGSARQMIGDRTQSLTAILKPNFAPIEQYADEPGMRQGPWTDLYALGATLHFMLTGDAPSPAVMRSVRDTLPSLAGPNSTSYPGVTPQLLATIDWTLALAPDGRPQSVAALRNVLQGHATPPLPTVVAPVNVLPERPLERINDATGSPSAEAALSNTSPSETPIRVRSRLSKPGIIGSVGLVVLGALAFAASSMSEKQSASAATTTTAASPAVSATAGAASSGVPLPTAERSEPASAPTATAAERQPESRATGSSRAPAVKSAKTMTVDSQKATAEARSIPAAPTSNTPAPVVATKTPKELCGDVNFVAMALCVSRQCQSPALQAHPQCVEARRFDEQRRRRMDQE